MQLRRAGFNIRIDGKWGPQTEAAYRTFAEGLVQAQVESEMAAPMLSFGQDVKERGQRTLDARDEEIRTSMQDFIRSQPVKQPWWKRWGLIGMTQRAGAWVGEELDPGQYSPMKSAREDIEKAIAEAPDGTYLSRVRDNRRMGRPDLEGLPPEYQRKYATLMGTPVMAGVAPPSKAFVKTLDVLDNLTQDIYQSTVGAPAGVAMFVASPIDAAKSIWNDYKYRYGPALEGDWKKFANRQAEHPLFAILDVASVVNVGAKGAQVAGLVSKSSKLRQLKVGNGYVQLYQPGSALGQLLARRLDAYSEANPDLAFVGANVRGATAIRQQADRTLDELRAQTVPFQRAAKRLNAEERMAYDVMARYGPDDAAQFLELELNKRWAAANDPEVPRAVRMSQKAQHRALRRSAAQVIDPSPKLMRALALGRELTEGPGVSTEQMKFSLKMLDPETAAGRKDLTAQIFGDLPEVGWVKSRNALYQYYREIYPEHFASLFLEMADSAALHWARQTGGAPEDYYRLHISEGRAAIPDANEMPEGMLAASWDDVPADRRMADRRGGPRNLGDLEGLKLPPEPDRRQVGPPPAENAAEAYAAARREKVIPREDELYQTDANKMLLDAAVVEIKFRADAGENPVELVNEVATKFGLEPGGLAEHLATRGDALAERILSNREVWNEGDADYDANRLEQRANKFGITVTPDAGRIRGVTDFRSGQAKIGLDPEAANVSTPLHEQAHVIRRFLPEATMRQLEDILGVEDGVWKREHEEKFAKMVETYFWRGQAPNFQLRAAFAELRAGMREVYRTSPRPGGVSAEEGIRLYRLLDEVFDPTLAIKAGDGAFFMPDVASWRGRGSVSGRRKSLRQAKTKQQKNRGVLAGQGRIQRGPKVTVMEFNRTARLYENRVSIKQLEEFAEDLDLDEYPETGGVPPGYGLFNPKGVEVPRVFRETPTSDDLFGRFPHEMAREMQQQRDELLASAFPSDLEMIPEEYRRHARVLPLPVIEAFTGDKVAIRMARSPRMDKLLAAVDTSNAIFKAALIYGKLSYIPLNLAGNMVFLTLAAGPFAGPALVRASRGLGGLDPELLAQMDLLVGEGAAAALALEERNALTRTVNKLAYAQSAVADRLPRRAAWIYYAGKAGFISEGAIRKLLEGSDEVWKDGMTFKQARFQISEAAERSMVQFRGMSPFQQEVISRAVFIYGWIRGATKYGLHSAIERPIRTNITLQLGQDAWDEIEGKFGKLVSYIDGVTPVGKIQEMLGVETVPVRSTQAINPVSTAGEALAAIYNTAKGDMKKAGPVISDYLAPSIKTPIEFATGFNIFFGERYDNRWEAVYGQPMRFPAIKIGKQLISPEITDSDVADQPVERQPNYIIPSEGAARKEALWELFLGSARERNLNFKAAKTRGREQRGEAKGYADYREELIDRLEEAGMDRPPDVVLEELRRQVELDADPRLDKGTSYKDKLAATAEIAGFEAPAGLPEAAAEDMYLKLRKQLFANLNKWENQADAIIDAQLEEE